jgi:hypothetical protein
MAIPKTQIKDHATATTVAMPLKVENIEILDIVTIDDTNFTFNEANTNGLNNVKLSGAGDITIVTGELATRNTIFNESSATGNALTFGNVTNATDGFKMVDNLDVSSASVLDITMEEELTSNTYLISGNYNSATGLFTATSNGVGDDTLIYEGTAASALNLHTNAIVLVGVDADILTIENFM